MMFMIILSTIISFCTFILEDPKYYNVPQDKIGGVLGKLGLYSEIFVITADVLCGPIIDIFGRRYPVAIGFFVASIFIFLIP